MVALAVVWSVLDLGSTRYSSLSRSHAWLVAPGLFPGPRGYLANEGEGQCTVLIPTHANVFELALAVLRLRGGSPFAKACVSGIQALPRVKNFSRLRWWYLVG